MEQGQVTPELQRARAERIPAFTHFLDIPLLLAIVALGAIRPDTWTLAIAGMGIALAVAAALTIALPRLYPWVPSKDQA